MDPDLLFVIIFILFAAGSSIVKALQKLGQKTGEDGLSLDEKLNEAIERAKKAQRQRTQMQAPQRTESAPMPPRKPPKSPQRQPAPHGPQPEPAARERTVRPKPRLAAPAPSPSAPPTARPIQATAIDETAQARAFKGVVDPYKAKTSPHAGAWRRKIKGRGGLSRGEVRDMMIAYEIFSGPRSQRRFAPGSGRR